MSIYRFDRWQAAATMALLTVPLLATAPALAQDRALARTADDPGIEWLPCPGFMPDGCGIAVLQGDPSAQNADLFFKLPAGSTAPRHHHTSAERMVLVAGAMEVDYDGQEPVVLEPGTYAYGPPHLPHAATCVSEADCVLFIAFVEPVDAVASGNPFTPDEEADSEAQ